ncbi:MAG: hypothetical protein PF487_08315 [Bacteroidales bacterium]|jgi:hypothetical protein|nr:hypothetical protein [Bacteroidales bacterium]
MKKLIKLALIVIAVLVFAFSSNTTIDNVRTKTMKIAKNLYENVIKEQETKVTNKLVKIVE